MPFRSVLPSLAPTCSTCSATRCSGSHTQMKPRSCFRQRVAGCLLSAVAAGVSAQSHEVERGGVVLRSSSVASDRIDATTARLHGIEPSPDRAVLNVVLLTTQPNNPPTLPAQVSASSINMAGVRNVIEMREVRENDRVSYMGSYAFAPREVLDFEVTALPTGTDQRAPLTLRYRERMWTR